MGLVDIPMYTVKCDNCEVNFQDTHTGFAGWVESSEAEYQASESGWFVGTQQGDEYPGHEEKHYCASCYEFGDDDELIVKAVPPKADV